MERFLSSKNLLNSLIETTEKLANPVKLGFLSKLFVWSVLMEPLLLFVVAGQATAGVGGNISRLLQLIVVVSLAYKFVFTRASNVRVPNPFHYHYKWYFYYLLFLIISFLVGYYNGYFKLNSVSFADSNYSGFSYLLNSTYTRPIFEYVISAYYFIYFVILPRYLINSTQGIDYFFKIFIYTFYACLILGLLDYFLIVFLDIENFIPRHLSDFRDPGRRFHGLAGEPRDAIVYMGFGLGILFLRDLFMTEKRTPKPIILLVMICMLLTESFSGFVGLLIGVTLIAVYQVPRIPVKYIAALSFLLVLGSVAIFFTVVNSERVLKYVEALPLAVLAFQKATTVPPVIEAQIANIYPVWIRLTELLDMNLVPLFFGSGLGTASIANNIFYDVDAVYNPHANFIRIFFESGIIGSLLYANAFLHPIRRIIKDRVIKNTFIYYLLIILGLNLGHRSSTIFIFLGISLLIFSHINNQKNESQTPKS
mgnify:CR=1 FL=1|tara:strand:- start:9860 stop:11299 length:1440 start_codon:yes stop_codon:yes gene_type:complete